MYDYLIVGAGLFGAVFAHEARKQGKSCLVIEKRNHVAGNIYTEEMDGIQVHQYGAHIFHTNNKEVWDYVNKFVEFNRFTNSPVANYKGKLYNLPFNMNTFYALWGVTTPEEAKEKIQAQRAMAPESPTNLEEQAISLVGKDIYEKLIKGYTEKQWGRPCSELPAFIIRRLPVRYTFDNNYFNDRYQGIPVEGYTALVKRLFGETEVRLNTDYYSDREYYNSLAKEVIFTGAIDQYYDYCFGELEYRSLYFETEKLPVSNYQGNAVVNYTEYEIPYTRVIEHKFFNYVDTDSTIITKEYPKEWNSGDEPYYPVNDDRNNALYEKYQAMAAKENKVHFCGRLGDYRYYDMHHVVEKALELAKQLCQLNEKKVGENIEEIIPVGNVNL